MTTDVWDDSRERGRGPVGSSMSDDDADGADGGAVRARGVARGQDGCMKEGPPMARFYVHGVLMYAYSDGMVMMGGDELRAIVVRRRWSRCRARRGAWRASPGWADIDAR